MTTQLNFKGVDADTWPDLVQVFESRGGPHYCWCMAWRRARPETKSAKGPAKKALLKASLHDRVDDGMPIGILAYRGGEPVGWCSVAPRPTYRTIAGRGNDERSGDSAIWSVACFYLKRELRGQGLTKQMLEAAVTYAQDNGAQVVEGYPVAPAATSYGFMGRVPMFESAGFKKVGMAGKHRNVMQLDCSYPPQSIRAPV